MATVLIGLPGAGKSSVGPLVARQLAVPFIDADAESSDYYAEVGWSVDRLLSLADEVGFERAHESWEEALTHAVERLVDAHSDAVIALGAGHTHVTQPLSFSRVRAALAGIGPVVLLRPNADKAQSLDELRQRCMASKGHGWVRDGVDWLDRWMGDGRDEAPATAVVYTSGETPAETAARISDQPTT